MGFFQRFFKQPEKETIRFEELDKWITKKEEENSKTRKIIAERKAQFAKDLEKQITILQNINLDERKADARVKAITKGNLEKYITHLTTLKENADLVAFTKSEKNYQRATLLVGKELGDTRNIIVEFAKFMNKHTKNNTLETIKEKKERLDNDESEAIEKTIQKIKTRQQAAEKEEKQNKEKREQQQKTYQEQKTAYEAAVKAMKKNILTLKTMIDFKKLSSIFHASKEMSTVKEYKEHFETTLENDDATLIKLLEEAKLSNKNIPALIKTIQKQRKALNPPTRTNTVHHARDFSKELTREENRLEKVKQEQEALKTSLQADLEELGIILEL